CGTGKPCRFIADGRVPSEELSGKSRHAELLPKHHFHEYVGQVFHPERHQYGCGGREWRRSVGDSEKSHLHSRSSESAIDEDGLQNFSKVYNRHGCRSYLHSAVRCVHRWYRVL